MLRHVAIVSRVCMECVVLLDGIQDDYGDLLAVQTGPDDVATEHRRVSASK